MTGDELLGHFDVKSGTVLLFDFGCIAAFAERGSAKSAVIAALEAGANEVGVVGYVKGVAVSDVAQGRYTITARRFAKGDMTGMIERVFVDLSGRPDVAAKSVPLGNIAVDSARIGAFDVAAIDEWNELKPADGLADIVFWGLHGEEVAKRFDAPCVDGNIYGFVDRPVRAAAELAQKLDELRQVGEFRFAFDFRPHTDPFFMLAKIRSSPTESGTIDVGGHAVCGFMTSVGDGFFPATLEVDADGRPLRCTIEIATEEEDDA